MQAQPITLGHYVSAYANALDRQATRMREAYARLNQSPLGAAALGTSSFPVDRPRLAELLGFDAPVENSLDANQISPIDGGAELAGLSTSAALTLGTFIADVTAQYAQTEPWIILTEGNETGVSSIMPQKRNPSGLVRLRAEASTLIGEATTFAVIAHNVEAGMSDYKDFGNPKEFPNVMLRDMAALFAHAESVIRTMRFRPERALDEVNSDYSTTTELADTLQREADVPFRIGHHFASELVNYGRGNRLRASQIPYSEAQRIYAEIATAAKMDAKLPLSEEAFRRSLSAENMVTASKGLGGPQPAEVARMLAGAKDRLAADRAWLEATRKKLADASERLRRSVQPSSRRARTGPPRRAALLLRALPDHAGKAFQRHQRLAGIGPFLQLFDGDVIERLPPGAAREQRARNVDHVRRATRVRKTAACRSSSRSCARSSSPRPRSA